MSARARFTIAASVVVVSISALIVIALGGSTTYYRTPTELVAAPSDSAERVRLAGDVAEGSIERTGPTTAFEVTDGTERVRVVTSDVLPDTFGAGVEVVAEGALGDDGVFTADTVLAKCPSKFKARAQG